MSDLFSDFIQHSINDGPRLTKLASFFENLTLGKSDMPQRDPRADQNLFYGDQAAIDFCEVYEKIMGTFSRHFFASIPHIMENECRVGVALLEYANVITKGDEDLRMFCLSNADGTFARAISDASGSRILTLTNSCELGNKKSFFRFGTPKKARFVLGTFLDVTPEAISNNPELAEFNGGFDIIFEHEAFQMFSNRRMEQLAFVTRLLKPNGLMILSEKLSQEDINEYRARERKKDEQFKTQYFSLEQIQSKEHDVVRVMMDCLVTQDELSEVLSHYFSHAVLIWNSTNFNLIVASDSEKRILTLLHAMLPPCIPPEYCYETIPKVLLGMPSQKTHFRLIHSSQTTQQP